MLRAPDGQAIEVTTVLAQETGALDGVKPIQWRLLTNRVATTLRRASNSSIGIVAGGKWKVSSMS